MNQRSEMLPKLFRLQTDLTVAVNLAKECNALHLHSDLTSALGYVNSSIDDLTGKDEPPGGTHGR